MSKEDVPDWGSLCLVPGGLEAVMSRPDGSEASEQDPVMLEGDLEETLDAWKDSVPEVRQLVMGLSASDILFMVLDLPTQDRLELDSMVDLQAEELSPFPPERTQVAWEVLKPLDSGGSRVLLTLLPLQKLEALHEPLLSSVGIPDRIDVDVLGWIQQLSTEDTFPGEQDGWMLLFIGEDVILVAWYEAAPVLIRVLGSRAECTPEVLLEELQQARIPVETAFPNANLSGGHLWYTGAAPEGLEGDSPLASFDARPVPPGSSASQGLLERSLEADTLDLTPVPWKQEVQNQLRLRKLLKTAGAVLLGAFWGWAAFRTFQVAQLEALNVSRNPEVNEIRVLTDQIRSLSQFTDRSQSALEALRILAEVAPGSGSLELEDFRYKKQDGQLFSGKMGGSVQPFNRFLDSLTATKALVVEDYDLKQTRGGYEFRLETDWQWEEGP